MHPVFIGGAGRSGTTLMVDLLGLHPQLSPVYETDFVPSLIKIIAAPAPAADRAEAVSLLMDRWTACLQDRPSGKRAHERYHHGPHYLRFTRQTAMELTDNLVAEIAGGTPWRGLQKLVLELFAEHAAADGKPYWINKNPSYVLRLPELSKLFPGMKFIHCVRDGRAVAASAMTRSWGPKTIAGAATWWSERVVEGLLFEQAHPGQVLRVRYEALLQDPVQTFSTIEAWLGLPAGGIVDRHHRAGFAFDPSRLDAWKTQLTLAQQTEFGTAAGRTLRLLGYTAAGVSGSTPAGAQPGAQAGFSAA
ncbi:MAG: hypothetical protein ACI9VR_003439 [Cognaticolwellia sp.]|jgi:hypothetical protein